MRLLAALCNDITEGAILKAEIAQRAEQALELAAERQKQLAEVCAVCTSVHMMAPTQEWQRGLMMRLGRRRASRGPLPRRGKWSGTVHWPQVFSLAATGPLAGQTRHYTEGSLQLTAHS